MLLIGRFVICGVQPAFLRATKGQRFVNWGIERCTAAETLFQPGRGGRAGMGGDEKRSLQSIVMDCANSCPESERVALYVAVAKRIVVLRKSEGGCWWWDTRG